MDLNVKYISRTDAVISNKDKKVVLSDDAYAVCDFISELIKQIEKTRVSLK